MGEELGCDFSVLLCRVSVDADTNPESVTDLMEESEIVTEKETTDTQSGGTEKSGNGLPKSHACDFPGCKAKFSRPWKLSAHKCTHTGERPYKCKIAGCNKCYTNLTHLRRHTHAIHIGGKESKHIKSSILERPPLIRCDHFGCCRLFAKRENLKKHICKNHSEESPKEVKCPDCDEVFTDRNQLRCHMFTHDGIPAFKCELCYRSFRYQNEVTKHVRKHKTYLCKFDDCPDGHKIFSSHNELRTHLVQAHPSRFACDTCDKVFSLKCRLKTHKLSCGTDKNEKIYKCLMEDCDHTFKFYRNMVQHVKHKHCDPLYTCTVDDCNKSFVWKTSYKKHVNTVHDSKAPGVGEEIKNKTDKFQPKKRRKDAGIPKQSAAELLSGVLVDKKTKQQLLLKEEVDSTLDSELLQLIIDKADDNR